MLYKEQFLEAAREFLAKEISGEDFLETIDGIIRGTQDSDDAVKWLCEQIQMKR